LYEAECRGRIGSQRIIGQVQMGETIDHGRVGLHSLSYQSSTYIMMDDDIMTLLGHKKADKIMKIA
jgi:hypothetical protein